MTTGRRPRPSWPSRRARSRFSPTTRERLSLQGDPDPKKDWYRHSKSGEVVDFVAFARTERQFARQFAADGTPSAAPLAGRADRLANWRRLQELAGLR
ncbi:MAG: hypothetical protein HY728_05195 [Candidatus Rokubacteria bacterium]|nr:hypothetical protein [Candidatus Rokubacteria bacterium]MBI4593591.1 hypothetical protein [Candidatus Rokubacteria bacterium]